MRFGEFTLYMPALLKPAPAALLTMLWALWSDRNPGDVPPPSAGRVSIELNESLPHAYYYAGGYRPSGTRAVRIDMLERLAGLIRTARNESTTREGFETTAQMMSLVGCSGEDFEAILRSLGFRKNVVKRKVVAEAKPTPSSEPQSDTSTPEAAAKTITTESETTEAPSPATEQVAEQETTTDPATAASAEQETPAKIDTATTDAANVEEEVELTLWRPAMRRPKPTPKPAARRKADGNTKSEQKDTRGRGPNQNKNKGRGPKSGNRNTGGRPQQGKGGNNRPPREKKADPNSPFAVLAGLKAELSDSDKKAKSKEPEKA